MILTKRLLLPFRPCLAGILALLDDPMPELKSYALRQLTSPYDLVGGVSLGSPAQVIDVFWAEVSDAVGAIEQLHEDANFKDRKLAALVASKVRENDHELVRMLVPNQQIGLTQISPLSSGVLPPGLLRRCPPLRSGGRGAL